VVDGGAFSVGGEAETGLPKIEGEEEEDVTIDDVAGPVEDGDGESDRVDPFCEDDMGLCLPLTRANCKAALTSFSKTACESKNFSLGNVDKTAFL